MPKPRQRDPDRELGRLCAAIQKARLQLRHFREVRLGMVREFLGKHYSEDAAAKPVPINLMAMYVGIVGRKLIPKNPRVMLSTFERQHNAAVSIMQEWANGEIEHLNLANTLRRIVVDALFCLGIAKVGIATPEDAQSAGWTLEAGQPFIERIDLDDFAYDVHAKDFTECGWQAHRTRVPLSMVQEQYGRIEAERGGSEDKMFNLEGDERIGMIGRGYYSADEDYEDFVDLWEIYLRRERKIITVLDDDLTGCANEKGDGPDTVYGKGNRRALREQDWIGPYCGPYHILGFGTAPGQAMPKGPIHDIYDLHLAVNNIARKLIRQAQDTKKITMITGGNDSDAVKVTSTPDGHAVLVQNPKDVQQAVMNEPNQALAVLMEAFYAKASAIAGNLELMGGLGPQAKTATQDKLNDAAASSNIGSLQDDTLNFVSDVLRSWLWFHHHHPTNAQKVTHTLADLPRVSIVRRSFPDNPEVHQNAPGLTVRTQSFDEMRIKVDPYSLQHQTPQQRAAMILEAVRNVYLPMAQLAQQQGVGLDLNALFRKLGEFWDLPDLEEIFTFMEKPAEEGGGQGAGVSTEGAGMPQDTSREYIRRSQGGDSQQAKEALMSNMMQKGASQNGQAQTIGA